MAQVGDPWAIDFLGGQQMDFLLVAAVFGIICMWGIIGVTTLFIILAFTDRHNSLARRLYYQGRAQANIDRRTASTV